VKIDYLNWTIMAHVADSSDGHLKDSDCNKFSKRGHNFAFLVMSAACSTCLPNGCAFATHTLGDWVKSAERDRSLRERGAPIL